MTIQEMRQAVCDWSKQSYAEKLFAGTSGNLSVYDKDQNVMVITPTSIPYETITPEDMVVLRLDGEILEGIHRPSSEWRMHAAVYEAKPEAGASPSWGGTCPWQSSPSPAPGAWVTRR